MTEAARHHWRPSQRFPDDSEETRSLAARAVLYAAVELQHGGLPALTDADGVSTLDVSTAGNRVQLQSRSGGDVCEVALGASGSWAGPQGSPMEWGLRYLLAVAHAAGGLDVASSLTGEHWRAPLAFARTIATQSPGLVGSESRLSWRLRTTQRALGMDELVDSGDAGADWSPS